MYNIHDYVKYDKCIKYEEFIICVKIICNTFDK